MKDNLVTMLKIILLSSILSIIIKYGGRMLSLSPSLFKVMIPVFLPSVVMTGLFLWRWKNQVEVK